jgi:membrane protein implicated in regulation of membrane protease activity
VDSSLIFLALIGVWLVYLVPTWLSRREEASESRVDDRFSASMRLLGPRRPVTSGRGPAHGYLLGGPAPQVTHVTHTREVSAGASRRGASRPGRVRAGLVALLALSMVVCAVLVGLALVGFGSWLQAVGSLVLPVAAVATLRWRVLRRARRVNPGASGSQPALVGRVVAVPARDLEVIDLRDDDPSGDLNDVFGAGERRVHRDLEHRIAAAVVADADTRRAERRARRTGGRPELLPVDVPLPSFVLKPDAPARAKPLVIDLRDPAIDDGREDRHELHPSRSGVHGG